jgi:hypothetical protein
VECNSVTVQGATRCLPTGHVVRFLDDACTQPVVEKEDCQPIPTHATLHVGSQVACNADDAATYRVFRVTGEEDQEVDTVYSLNHDGTDCYASGVVMRTVRAAEEVDVEVFAEMTEPTEAIDDELGRLVETTADGAFRASGAWDLGRDAFCTRMIPEPEDGVPRCIPAAERRHSQFAYWGDDACGVPAIVVSTCDAEETHPIIDYRRAECGRETGVLHERGEPFDGHLHETFGNDPECHPQTQSFGVGLGPEIPTEDMPLLDVLRLAGDGDLSLELLGRADRAIHAHGYFALDGEGCFARVADDGTTRCVPGSWGHLTSNRYADAQCTRRLASVGAFDVACGVATIVAITEEPEEECTETMLVDVREAGPLHEGPTYVLSGESCNETAMGSSIYAEVGEQSLGYQDLPTLDRIVE